MTSELMCEKCGAYVRFAGATADATIGNLKAEVSRLQRKLAWVARNIDRIRDWSGVPDGVLLVVDHIQEVAGQAAGDYASLENATRGGDE